MKEFKVNQISFIMTVLIAGLFVGMTILFRNQLFLHKPAPVPQLNESSDNLLGWKLPPQSGGQVTDIDAYSKFRESGGTPLGLPVKLKIPIINVDTSIEDAYITPDGRMDVPKGSINVAWYALGARPGQIGSAVIGGHFGKRDNVPFVFYNLDKLKVGDKVYIATDLGDTLAFQVRSIKLFGRNDDATAVFTSSDGLNHLNLITCEGIWNKVNDSYPDRRVVFTDEIPSEGPITVKTIPIIAQVSKTIETSTPAASLIPDPVNTVAQDKVTVDRTDVKNLFATPIDAGVTSILLVLMMFMTTKLILSFGRSI